MFILTAFDRPPREYHWEEVFPVLSSKDPDDRPDFNSGNGIIIAGSSKPADTAAKPSAASVCSVDPVIPEGATPSEECALQMTALSAQLDQLRKTTQSLNEVSEVLLASYRAITENSDNINQSSTGYVEEMQSLNRN